MAGELAPRRRAGGRRRRRPRRPGHRRRPRLLRRRRPQRRPRHLRRRPAASSGPAGPLGQTIGGVPRDRGGVASLAFAALRKPVIARDQRRRGRHRRDHDAADGRPDRGGVGPLRLPFRPPRHHARGGVRLVPAAGGRHQPGDGVGGDRPDLRRRRGAARPAWSPGWSRTTSCCPPRGRWPPRSSTTPRGVAVAATRQLLWSMLGAPSPWDSHRLESRALMELGGGPGRRRGRDRPSWRSGRRSSARGSARARSPGCRAGRCRPTTSTPG